MRNGRNGILLAVMISTAPQRATAKEAKTPPQAASQNMPSNPYPTGTAKRVLGKVLIPVSAALGGTLFILGGLSTIGCDSKYSNRSAESCRSGRNTSYAGLALVAIGVPTGIVLIMTGNKERRRWEEWESIHHPATASAPSLSIGFAKTDL